MKSSIFKEAVNIIAPQTSKFDLSHEKKLSCEMGKLIPIMTQEIVPGDKFRVNSEIMVRFAPLLAPLYHRLDVYTHYFFVPNRIIWNEWERFITGGVDGLQAPVHPALDLTNAPGFINGTLMDYLGLPTNSSAAFANGETINALPFRAYAEIYNEYYRDETLIPKIAYAKDSGIINYLSPEYAELTTLRNRAWEKDYFTTALPFAQRGNPAGAPVSYPQGEPTIIKNLAGAPLMNQTGFTTGPSGDLIANPAAVNAAPTATANVLITELRKAARLQEFLEAAARGGARLTEWVRNIFGVVSSDARLQRPEYLGGGKTPVTISEVLSTYDGSGGGNDLPQGNQSGHGIAVGDSHGFSQTFEEHGFVIGIMSIVPKANYYQGIERMWSRPTRFDYLIPHFAHLGEQEVKNKEIYFDTDASNTNEQTFGYQSRYAEYKFKLSTIHGEFRDSLAYWHMARKFSATPGLNQTFIDCVPTKDIFPVVSQTENPLFIQIYHDVSAIRPLPYFSNPKL